LFTPKFLTRIHADSGYKKSLGLNVDEGHLLYQQTHKVSLQTPLNALHITQIKHSKEKTFYLLLKYFLLVSLEGSDGHYFEAIVGVVIAVVVLVLLLLLAIVLRYMYQHKGTYHTNEAKGTEFAETADAALRGDPALQDATNDNKKEYFI
ncbi:hypothetical protein IRJ41_016522, partial [Triplophysa rosa]